MEEQPGFQTLNKLIDITKNAIEKDKKGRQKNTRLTITLDFNATVYKTGFISEMLKMFIITLAPYTGTSSEPSLKFESSFETSITEKAKEK